MNRFRLKLREWEERLGALFSGGSGAGPKLVRNQELVDDEFRSMCAVWNDGRYLVVEGFQQNAKLRSVLGELQMTGVLPSRLQEEVGTSEEVRMAWRGRPVDVSGDPVIRRRVMAIYTEAAEARAADVMFELTENEGCEVFVIANDAKVRMGERMTFEMGKRVTGYLFHLKDPGSGQTGYQRDSFQGFSLRNRKDIPLPPQISRLRCQRGPSEPDRDHMFTRIFYNNQLPQDITLEKLGYEPKQAQVFAEVRASLKGAVFVGGKTGDGKSTSLAAVLMLLYRENRGEINLITVEDPVEYPIPGAIQIAVPTTGSGEERAQHYKEALMHFCRVHPAAGMVSEIRDGDAARQVLQFVDSGHQVYTTIHVANANSILFRLRDLGVEAGEVCKPGNIALLVQQTLVPMLCRHCALARDRSEAELPQRLERIVSNWRLVRFRNPQGCKECVREGARPAERAAWAGYTKRPRIVAEMIRPDAGYLEFVRDGDTAGAYKYWVETLGGMPLGSQIWNLVAQGLVDPLDGTRKGASYEGGEAFGQGLVDQYLGAVAERGGAPLLERYFVKLPGGQRPDARAAGGVSEKAA